MSAGVQWIDLLIPDIRNLNLHQTADQTPAK
jgi:hypothetical protein